MPASTAPIVPCPPIDHAGLGRRFQRGDVRAVENRLCHRAGLERHHFGEHGTADIAGSGALRAAHRHASFAGAEPQQLLLIR